MLDKHQKELFSRSGLIHLEGILLPEEVDAARNEIFQRFERRGLRKAGKWQSQKLAEIPAHIGVTKLVGKISEAYVFGELIIPEIMEVISTLLNDRPVFSPSMNGQLLITLPNASRWSVPYANWHLDVSRLPGFGIPGVQVFTFLDMVEPSGGGTLVVAGSHRLLNENKRISSKQVRVRLQEYDYFRKLMHQDTVNRDIFLTEPGSAGDVELQVVELHGKPGDVYLTDMRLLHAPSPNSSEAPRIMWTKRYFLEEAYEEMYGKN